MNNQKNRKKWVELMDDTLRITGRSEKTVQNYNYSIKKFLNSYDEKTKISTFTEKDIMDYLKKEYLNRHRSASTYNYHTAALLYFYLVCFNRELSKKLLPHAKEKRKLPTIITKEMFVNIFNEERNLEHKCWLLLGFCCGLRVEEVATIRIENIDSKNHKLKVLGKGNKERITILPDIVIKFLRIYCKTEGITQKTGYLFRGICGKERINTRTIGNYFTLLADKKGLPENISFHTLRHSFATYFIMNGGDQHVLKNMLGHASLNTTTIYLHLAKDFNNLKGINYDK